MSERVVTGEDTHLAKPVNCTNCAALCCRSTMKLNLKPDELAFMREPGTKIVELRPPRRLLPLFPVRRGAYQLESDCAHLLPAKPSGERQCDAHDDPARPKDCQTFMPGTVACRALRMHAGIDTPEDFQAFLAATGEVEEVRDATLPSLPLPPAEQPPLAA